MKISLQTRIKDLTTIKVLDQLGPKLALVTRFLFSQIFKKQVLNKPELSKKFSLTARHYNSCLNEAEAKYQNSKENKANQVIALKTNIKAVEKNLRKTTHRFKIHHKTRYLESLKNRLEQVDLEIQEQDYSCIFGSKELWLQQFRECQDHQSWKQAWELARNYNFQVIGCHSETMGNNNCQLSKNLDSSFNLKLRLPNDFPEKFLKIPNLNFSYGLETLNHVYFQNLDPKDRQVISYRFHKDTKGWIVTLTTDLPLIEIQSQDGIGVLGVDLNPDHLAIVETDRFGNPINKQTIALDLIGKTHHQSLTIIGEAAKKLVNLALAVKKPIILEKLDFATKKAMLAASHSPEYAKMLSSFAYSTISRMVESRAFRHGIQVLKVNPAFTSLIGLLKFKRRYGLTTHQAAALVIGRRCHHWSERLPKSKEAYHPWINNVQVALEKPEDSSKHVWSSYGKLKRQMETFWKKKRRTKDPKREVVLTATERSVIAEKLLMFTQKVNPENAVPSQVMVLDVRKNIDVKDK